MVSFPPCKINLGLQVTGKRSDGYHDLVTCFYPVPWCDVLEIIPSDSFQFCLTGQEIGVPAGDNLCVQAYDMLRKEFALSPVAIHLHKIIPIGAGLGGGSSDAAYTLKGLNALFELGLTTEALMTFAARLGSDCPFFVESRPMIGTGRGDALSEVALDLKGKFLFIVKPAISISTREAFAAVKPKHPAFSLKEVVERHPVTAWRNMLENDFEQGVSERFPVIAEIRQKLYGHGAVYASMSGSGSAVYGLFEKEVNLGDYFEGATSWSGFLH